MKIRAKKILLIFFIIVLFLSALYKVLVMQARNVFISNLRRLTGQTVSIKTLTYLPPCNFHLKNLEIGERKDQRYFFTKRISISVALLASLWQRQPVFTGIHFLNPRLYFEREETAKDPAQKPGAHNAVFLYFLVMALFIMVFKLGGELTVLYPVYATTFIWAALIVRYLLHETFSLAKGLGMIFIILGVFFIAK